MCTSAGLSGPGLFAQAIFGASVSHRAIGHLPEVTWKNGLVMVGVTVTF